LPDIEFPRKTMLNTLKSHRTLALTTLLYTLAVILWGAFVRVTGSGAGCGDHWPLCNGAVLPRSPTLETVIEFTHRFTSGILLLLMVLWVFSVFRTFAKGHPARFTVVLSAVFLVIEALLGAGLVIFEMVADNPSVARGWWMAAHLVNTFILLGWVLGRGLTFGDGDLDVLGIAIGDAGGLGSDAAHEQRCRARHRDEPRWHSVKLR
jgi:heme A synthase